MPEPRYEREIRTLLEELDEFLPGEEPRPLPSHRPPPTFRLGRWLTGPVAWFARYPLLAIALLLVVAHFLPALPVAGRYLAVACVAVAAFLLFWWLVGAVRRALWGVPYERRWRGRSIDPPPGQFYRSLGAWWRRVGGRQ